jgi:hypothetical protein
MNINPEDAIRESYPLILKLKEITRRGKIEWTTVADRGSVSGAILKNADSAFEAKVGGDLCAIVWENLKFVGFDLVQVEFSSVPPHSPQLQQARKDYEREVLSIRLNIETASSGDITDESIVFEDLVGLLELIRRAPRQFDVRIEKAKNYLDELAS